MKAEVKYLFRARLKDNLNYRFRILHPSVNAEGKGHKKFRLQKWVYDTDTGKRLPGSTTIKDPVVAAINQAFLKKKITADKALESLQSHIERLYKEANALQYITHSSDNLRALEIYLERNYPASRVKRIDYETALGDCKRAIEALENVSLLSAPIEDIQEQLDAWAEGDASKQRRIAGRLNAILRIVRPESPRLTLWRAEENGFVPHLTLEEFKQVLLHLPKGPIQTLAQVSFYVGCRVGEAFALTPKDLREVQQTVFIHKQILNSEHDRGTVKNRTKNGKIRNAFIFKEGIPALKEWFKVKGELDKRDRESLACHLRNAQLKAFPGEDLKVTRWHDLRHCYAIRLLSKGLTVDYVARMIGDSPKVCEKYYVGYILNDAAMDVVRSRAES